MRPHFCFLSPAQRRRQRSQSVVEFTLILPMFLALVFGLVDFGFMISNSNRLALVVREGANIVSRTSLSASVALSSMVQAGNPEIDLSNQGAAIITFLIQDVNNVSTPPGSDGYLTCVLNATNGGLPSVFITGSVFGDDNKTKNESRLLNNVTPPPSGIQWQAQYRKIPMSTTNLVQGENVYVVEAFLTNRFITPIGELLSYGGTNAPFAPPAFLYDAAYF